MHSAMTTSLSILGATVAAAGLYVVSLGLTSIGMFAFGAGTVVVVSTLGAGLPKPYAVPRPGEEDQYD